MSHHYQCWTQLQDHSHHYKYQSEIVIILPFVLYSCLWQFLKPSSSRSFHLPHFVFSKTRMTQSCFSLFLHSSACRYRSFPSVLSSSTTHPISAVLLPWLISLPPHPLGYLSSKLLCPHVQLYPILTCLGMAPSLLTSKHSVLPWSETVFLQNNTKSFPICLCFTF